MTAKADFLETRFLVNMNRISKLVRLIYSHDALKATTVFGGSSGVRADILRSIVVFLHATFEVGLRSHIPKTNRKLSFSARTDHVVASRACVLLPASHLTPRRKHGRTSDV